MNCNLFIIFIYREQLCPMQPMYSGNKKISTHAMNENTDLTGLVT